MASLIPLTDLAFIATGAADGIPADDPFGTWVLEQVSDLVRNEARHPEWVASGGDGTTTIDAPYEAKRIALVVARRVYVNSAQEVSSGVGPLSSTVLEEAAAGLRLTELEAATLQGMRGTAGDGNPNGMWILTNSEGLPTVDTGYVFDDSGSDWAIPYIDFPSTDAMTDPTDTVV